MVDLADALSNDIQALLSSPGRYFTTQDIIQSLGGGVLRRDVSRCLYELERYGLVEKVNESPPTWVLLKQQDHVTSSDTYERGPYSYGEQESYYKVSSSYEQEPEYDDYYYEREGPYDESQYRTSKDDPWFTAYTSQQEPRKKGSVEKPKRQQYTSYYKQHTEESSSGRENTTKHSHEDAPGNSRQVSATIRSGILESLLHSANPKTATELAYELGLKGASSVNIDLYAMEREGLLRRIYNPASPILWELSSRPEREGPSPNIKVHVAPHKHSTVPPRMVTMATQGSVGRSNWVGSPRQGGRGTSGRKIPYSSAQHEPHPSSSATNKRRTRFSSPLPERPAVVYNQQPSLPSSSNSSAFSSNCFVPTLSSIPAYSDQVELIMTNLYDPVGPLTANDIAKLVKMDRSSVNSLLYNLERDGMALSKKESGPPQWIITKKGKMVLKPKLIANAEKGIYNMMKAAPQKVLNSNQIVTLLQGKVTGNADIIDEALKGLVDKGSITMVMGSDPPIWSIASNLPSEEDSSTGTETVVEPLVVNSTTLALVNDLNSSAMTVLSQYAQANQVPLSTEVLYETGPTHSKKFVVGVTIGNVTVKSQASTKKEAKRMAADLALQKIRATQLIQAPPRPAPPTSSSTQPMEGVIEGSGTSSSSSPPKKLDNMFHNYIAGLARDLHTKLEFAASVPQPGRKVIACFIMEDTELGQFEVISFGSGTRCVSGDKMDLQGRVVNDSHAEVIARRSLRRFFYQELRVYHEQGDEAETIFEPVKGSLVRVKDSIKFHLYISTAPCGDGAQFSRDDTVNREPPLNFKDHTPTMTGKSQGVLRSKMEGGEGTIPVGSDSQAQTWDGIQQGSRLRTMSCSDKVASWNVLGLQGSLLSLFMRPVYLSSLTLGSLHHHGHLSRAVCCRLEGLANRLPLSCNYHVNHPTLGRVDGGDEMKRHTEKTTNSSLNWVINDPAPEIIDGVIGRPGPYLISQVAKTKFFTEFRSLCEVIGAKGWLAVGYYSEAKKLAREYHSVKATFHQYCIDKGYGVWVRKPAEQDQFTFSSPSATT